MEVIRKIYNVENLIDFYNKRYNMVDAIPFDNNNDENKILYVHKESKAIFMANVFAKVPSYCFMHRKISLLALSVFLVRLTNNSQIRYHRYFQMIYKVLIGPVIVLSRRNPLTYAAYTLNKYKLNKSYTKRQILQQGNIIVLEPYTQYQFIIKDIALLANVTLQYANINYDCLSNVYSTEHTIAIDKEIEL